MEGKQTADIMDFRQQNDDLVREILGVRWFLAYLDLNLPDIRDV